MNEIKDYYLIIHLSFFLRLRSLLSLLNFCWILLYFSHNATIFRVSKVCIGMALKLIFNELIDFHLLNHFLSQFFLIEFNSWIFES